MTLSLEFFTLQNEALMKEFLDNRDMLISSGLISYCLQYIMSYVLQATAMFFSTGCSAVSVTRPVPWQMVGWLELCKTGGIFLSVSVSEG